MGIIPRTVLVGHLVHVANGNYPQNSARPAPRTRGQWELSPELCSSSTSYTWPMGIIPRTVLDQHIVHVANVGFQEEAAERIPQLHCLVSAARQTILTVNTESDSSDSLLFAVNSQCLSFWQVTFHVFVRASFFWSVTQPIFLTHINTATSTFNTK